MKKIILLSCILILLPLSVCASTINVSADQSTIQAGIDASVDGDVVLLAEKKNYMVIDFAKLSTSDYAAWWGATIATLALIWNIVVAIRSGARIKVRATANMKAYPVQSITEDNTYISVTAVNHGTSPTTITHFCGCYAPTFWDLINTVVPKNWTMC